MSKALKEYAYKGVEFYLTPSSQFPSGQMPLSELQNNTVKELSHRTVTVKTTNGPKQLSEDSLTSASDLFFVLIKDDKVYFNIGKSGIFHKVQDSGKNETWFSEEEMQPWDKDLGLALKLPSGQRLQFIKIENNTGHFKAESGSMITYPLSDVILKYDFVKQANCKGTLKKIKWREAANLRAEDEMLYPITECSQFDYDREKRIVTKANDAFIPLRTQITQSESVTWVQSKIKKHGIVYWKKVEKKDLKISHD